MKYCKYIFAIYFIFVSCKIFSKEHERDSLLHELHKTILPSDKIEILNLLAEEYFSKDESQAENYASQALFLAQSINDELGEAIAQYHLAGIAQNHDHFDEAFQKLKMAKLGLINSSKSSWIGKVDVRLAIEYKRRLEYEKALSLLLEALDIFTKLNDENTIAEINNHIGGVYFDQGNYEKAYQYYQNSYSIYSEINNEEGIGSLLINLGEIYRLTGKPEDAMSYYKKALLINTNLNREYQLAIIYNNIGNIYLSAGNADSATKYLRQSLSIGEKLQEHGLISSASISLGNLLIHTGNPAAAKSYFSEGLETAGIKSNIGNLRDACKGLSDIYAASGDYKMAYLYHDRFKSLSDSINSVQNQEKITRLEMQYIYNHEQNINKVRKQKKQLRYFLIASFLAIVLIAMILIYGRQKIKIKHTTASANNLKLEKQKLQEEIEFKNRELTTNVMYMVRKNELINIISQNLIKVRNKFDAKLRPEIQEIIIGLQSNFDKDIWKEFEVRFREVHKNFYDNLMKQHPNLTENEKKLCALLRLDMTTKEIAAITHQNPSSIEVARTRMRKKMNLSNTEINLNSYLSGL